MTTHPTKRCLLDAGLAMLLERGYNDPLAVLLIDCWDGGALRSRLLGSPAPLTVMLDFHSDAAAPTR